MHVVERLLQRLTAGDHTVIAQNEHLVHRAKIASDQIAQIGVDGQAFVVVIADVTDDGGLLADAEQTVFER